MPFGNVMAAFAAPLAPFVKRSTVASAFNNVLRRPDAVITKLVSGPHPAGPNVIRYVIQSNEVASPRTETGTEAVRYLQRYSIVPSLPLGSMEAPFGTEQRTTKIMSFEGDRLVACKGPADEPHDLLWFRLQAGEKKRCNDCEQVFEAVYPELEVVLEPYDPIDASPQIKNDYKQLAESIKSHPEESMKGYRPIYDGTGKQVGFHNTNKVPDVEKLLSKIEDGTYMEIMSMQRQYPGLHSTKKTQDAFHSSHLAATAHVKDQKSITDAWIKLMGDEHDIMAEEAVARAAVKKEMLGEIEAVSKKVVDVKEPEHVSMYFGIMDELKKEAAAGAEEEALADKFAQLVKAKFTAGSVDDFMHKFNMEVLHALEQQVDARRSVLTSSKFDACALQMGVSVSQE